MARRRRMPPPPKDETEQKLCDVLNCKEDKQRSMPKKKMSEAVPSMKWRKDLGSARRVQLCKNHYREYRKATKEARKLETLGRG